MKRLDSLKKWFGFSILGVCAWVPQWVSAEGLPVGELQLSGVTLAQSREQVREHLGTPVASHRTTDKLTGEPAEIHVFRRLTAYFVADETMRLKTTDSMAHTPAGARVGDSLERVLELYGEVEPRVRTPTRLEMVVDGTEAMLIFYLYRNRVTAIELVLDYG